MQSEEGGAELLRLLVAERSGRHAADGLPLEELAEDLDQHENALREAALQGALRSVRANYEKTPCFQGV